MTLAIGVAVVAGWLVLLCCIRNDCDCMFVVHRSSGASDFFGGAAALSSSRRHTPRELEGLRGADSFETVTYVTLSDGGAGATGSWVPWCFVTDCCEEGCWVPKKHRTPPK